MRKKLRELSVYLLPFILAVCIYSLITNYAETRVMFSGIVGGVMYVLSRFLIGGAIAYILDFLVCFLNKRLGLRRGFGIAVSYALLLLLLVSFVLYIIPLIFESVQAVLSVSQSAYAYLSKIIGEAGERLDPEVLLYIEDAISSIMDEVFSFIKSLLTYDSITAIFSASTNTLFNILIGLMISIFLLLEKNALFKHARRFAYAAFKPATTTRVLELAQDTNRIFSRFMLGKVIDSLVVFVITIIPYYIFGLPLAPFLSVVACVANLIPYFGPIVGTAIICFIVLCFNPTLALYALIINVILLTAEGYIVSPKILGDTVGISPLLILVAITIGGAVAGFMGMLLGVPILAVLKLSIYDRYIKNALYRKREQALSAEPDAPLPYELEVIENFDNPPEKKKKAKRPRKGAKK
ncbi:MAG: AI-2E family transporter [Oscillospiraceae bacterium]|jgi:predicted PurR-regulated permease PerM|nr:AI-2E family transporter [Oscillospiraceae bacterium]